MSDLIPCYVIAGPLGVGKTTTVLDFLEASDGVENTAVIVNDFGQTGLDAEVLSASGAEIEVRNIPGGCLCCSSILDMRDAIEAVRDREGLTRIIIEPSGLVVLPDFVPALERLCEEFRMELMPIIALLSPKRTKESHYKALPFFATLVDYADILVGNRIDQCTEAQLEHFREWTARLNPPKMKVLETSFGNLPAEVFELKRSKGLGLLKFYAPHTHEESSGGFVGEVPRIETAAFVDHLRAWIKGGVGGAELLRFKACLPTDSGWQLFEIADGSVYVSEMPEGKNAKLDWISRGEISEDVMRAELAACRA